MTKNNALQRHWREIMLSVMILVVAIFSISLVSASREIINIKYSGIDINFSFYQMLINITYNANMQKDFSDIRFLDTDLNPINFTINWSIHGKNGYEQGYVKNESSAYYLVKIPNLINNTNKIIYVDFGDGNITRKDNGEKGTYDIYEDFSSGILNQYWNIAVGRWINTTYLTHAYNEHSTIYYNLTRFLPLSINKIIEYQVNASSCADYCNFAIYNNTNKGFSNYYIYTSEGRQLISNAVQASSTTCGISSLYTNFTHYIYNGNYTTFMNGTFKYSFINNTQITNLDNFYIDINSADTGLTIDNIKMRSYTYPEPSYYYSPLIEISQTYNANTLEGTTETFIINITYDSSLYTNIEGYLWYNNTAYLGAKTSGDNILFTKSITVPIITQQTAKSFKWLFILTNATGDSYVNSSSNTQTINMMMFDDCTTYTNLTLNYTLKDEKTQVTINSSLWNATMELDLDLYDINKGLIASYSKLYNNTNNAKVCMNLSIGTSSYIIDAEMRYIADGYEPEYNYLQNFTLIATSIPQNINLFDLRSTQSTEFIVTYKDISYLPVENAIISLNRKYISEGIFKTVEMMKTDSFGQAKGHFDTNGVIYQIIATKNGTILSTFDNIAVFCEDVVTGNCKINLYANTMGETARDFYTYYNTAYQLSFNQTTRISTATFSTLDGTTALFSLNLTKYDMYKNTTICSKQVLSSSGGLTCDVPSTWGNLTFMIDFYKNGELITEQVWMIKANPRDIYGDNTVLLILGLILTLAFMFIPSPIGVIIGSILGLIISIVLFYTSGSIIGGTGFLIWIIIAGFILIWRIQSRGSE